MQGCGSGRQFNSKNFSSDEFVSHHYQCAQHREMIGVDTSEIFLIQRSLLRLFNSRYASLCSRPALTGMSRFFLDTQATNHQE